MKQPVSIFGEISVHTVMKSLVLVLVLAVAALAQDSLETDGFQVAVKIFEDCSKSDGFSPCLKKKAITALDRLSRMDRFNLAEGIVVSGSNEVAPEVPLSEDLLEKSLPRGLDAKDAALSGILLDKVAQFVGSRSVEITMPKLDLEEGRRKKMKGMMGGMFHGLGTKLISLIPAAIAGLFLLAGKALITAKIALLIITVIIIKKLFAAKHAHDQHGHAAVQVQAHHGGHGGGWAGLGGGWDKRSISEAQTLAYRAHVPK